ncbi:MAG: GHKL domain-containing protein, partial [Candidatus Coproplasma sp.]
RIVMTMMKYSGILDKVLLVTSIYFALFLYSASFKNSTGRSGKLRIMLFCISAAGVYGVCFLCEYLKAFVGINDYIILLYKNSCTILLIILCIASMSVLKPLSFRNFLFVGCASLATANCANHLYSLICSFFFGPDFERIDITIEIILRLVIFFVIYGAVYTFCWFVFVKPYRTNGKEYAISTRGYLLFIACFVINLFLGTNENMSDMPVRFQFIGKILMNLLILFFLFYQSKYLNLREENIKLQYIMEQQKEQFNIAKLNIDQINVKAHDLKHFVEIFKNSGGVLDPVLNELSNVTKEYDNMFDTGNKALDVTLTEKCRSFVNNSVEFSVIADGSCISFMSDIDVYVLFGNLIDNAREAVSDIQDESNRIIGLYLRRKDKFISLHVENTFFNKPQFENGLPKTSKIDKENHGFGTKSIQMIVEKYGGNMIMDCNDKLFTVDITFFTD